MLTPLYIRPAPHLEGQPTFLPCGMVLEYGQLVQSFPLVALSQDVSVERCRFQRAFCHSHTMRMRRTHVQSPTTPPALTPPRRQSAESPPLPVTKKTGKGGEILDFISRELLPHLLESGISQDGRGTRSHCRRYAAQGHSRLQAGISCL